VRVLTGASTGKSLDDALAEADAIGWRAPYQASRALCERINGGRVAFTDIHLSGLPRVIASGVLGPIDVAVVEATGVSADGRVYLSTSIGASPTFLRSASRVILEVNRHHSPRLAEMADIVCLAEPPDQRSVAIERPLDRVGVPYAAVDPRRVVGVVYTDEPDEERPFDEPDACCRRIADHVVEFLLGERSAGRIPAGMLPLQSGVGNVANAVLERLGEHPEVPPLTMYSEVLQDGAADLLRGGQLVGASATSLTLSPGRLREFAEELDFYAPRVVLRPQEITNHPGVIRRLGLIAVNTVIEVDLYGHANSTHLCGTRLVHGIGGSGDFERNAYLSIVVCRSFAKGGRISTIVPMCTHVDHSEHDVQVVVTEQGLADLRGLAPEDRARRIIDRCAHPAYREYLREYLRSGAAGHLRHDLGRCFELHRSFLERGWMLPGLDPGAFEGEG
jgi:acetyl-CoA hydrolase